MVIDNVKTEEEEEVKNQMNAPIIHTQTLVLNEVLIQEVEKGGFPKPYLIHSLNNDELNYATTYYYLLTTTKEF